MKKLLLLFISYRTAERIKSLIAIVVDLFGLTRLLSPSRRRGAAILMFHSVGDERSFSDNRLPADRFDAIVAWLKREWEVVPVSRIVDEIAAGREPSPRWVALTFDDGYRDNATVAAPILRRHGVTATFYPTVDVLEGAENETPRRLFYDEIERVVLSAPGAGTVSLSGARTPILLASADSRSESAKRLILEIRTWMPSQIDAVVRELVDRLKPPAAAAGRLYMSWNDLAALAAEGMGVGSHTMTHACLATIPREDMQAEVVESKRRLEARLGRTIDGLAFPFGKAYAVPRNAGPVLSAAGYRYALTTRFGRATAGMDLFDLPRIGIENAPLARVKVALAGLPL